jgi:predicted Zn finger-like uncharacterized protein
MLIDCPGCAKSYHIIKAALGPNGRRVACPRCNTIWFVPVGGEAEGPRSQDLSISAPIEISAEDVIPRGQFTKSARIGFEGEGTIPSTPASAPRGTPRPVKELLVGAALLMFAMAIIGFRADIVQLWAPSGTVYAALGMPVNLRGLELRNLHTVTIHAGAEAVLGIEGEIINLRLGATPVPPIDLAIRDQNGNALYSWTVASQKRAPVAGESILFRARLAEPPAGGATSWRASRRPHRRMSHRADGAVFRPCARGNSGNAGRLRRLRDAMRSTRLQPMSI